MQELDDNALLRKYVEDGSEDAFATLVTRHVNKVYSVALRLTRNPHQAEEITQAVFVILAQKSHKLSEKVILSGWLYQTARLTAITFVRSEIRRTRREQEAHMQTPQNESESDLWLQIAPLLDAAMAALSETDRHAIVLRFFDGKSMKEVGLALGASEDAVKMRVSRAVEKLRLFLSRRGVSVHSTALTAAISAHSVQAAPAMLARFATTIAVTKGSTASASTGTLIKGALKIMAWSKAKTAIVAAVGVLLAAGTATVTAEKVAAYRGEFWQRRSGDSSILDHVPPQTKILPALRSRDPQINWWGGRDGKQIGLGAPSSWIVQAAYDATIGRMIFAVPAPDGAYDFVCSEPTNQEAALQRAVKDRFGLVARHEDIETNVFILTLKNRDVPGLVPNSDPTGQNNSRSPVSIQCVYAPMSQLVYFLENALGTPVIDHTGLTGHFDIYIHWDGTREGLIKAMLTQGGLELVPDHAKVDFLVVTNAD